MDSWAIPYQSFRINDNAGSKLDNIKNSPKEDRLAYLDTLRGASVYFHEDGEQIY